MAVFWIIGGLMIVSALFFLVPPLIQRRPGGTHLVENDANVLVYREQLASHVGRRSDTRPHHANEAQS